MSPCRSTREQNLFLMLLFGFLFLTTVTALPWYAMRFGISRSEWLLFFFYVASTGLSVTVGYHRLFAHRSFQTGSVITFLNLFFGAAALEESALRWSSLHRDHHRYVDTAQDPYNIKQGFWHAHIGWMLFWRNVPDYNNVKDLRANPLIMHQHRNYPIWAIGTGVLLPLVIGAAMGHLLGVFLLVVVGRITLVHHTTWSINSICHMFGKATYDIDASARDHWLVAILTNGEGYHNFHHRFASDYRNGVRWYQWDPSKWAIAVLSWCGLARNLYRTPPYRIYAAKAAAEYLSVEREIRRNNRWTSDMAETVRKCYDRMRAILYEWENSERAWRQTQIFPPQKPLAYIHTARQQLREKRRVFNQARREWLRFIHARPTLIPDATHV